MTMKTLLLALLLSVAPLVQANDLQAARAATDARRFDEALHLFEQLLNARPADSDLLIETARVYGFADRHREAVATYRRVLEVAPARRHDVLPSLAWQTLWAGDPGSARTLFVQARDAAGPNQRLRAEMMQGEGEAAEALGDTGGAAAAYRQALALQPADAAVQRRLARTLNAAGRHAAAATLYAGVDDGTDAVVRLDHARARRWAGDDRGAHALLVGRTEPAAFWLRDWRLARELQTSVSAGIEHATDRDHLDTTALQLNAGRWFTPTVHGELAVRHLRLDEPASDATVQRVAGRLSARFGAIEDTRGLWVASLALAAQSAEGWHPLTGSASLRWLPSDGWRFAAELGRELIETPMAVSNRVTVNVAALSAEHRLAPRWSAAASIASLNFSDHNTRTRFNGRVGYLIRPHSPRIEAGVEAMAFESSRPASFAALPPPGSTPPVGYWNPRRYVEGRAFVTLEGEAQPLEWQMKVALGSAREVDGDGNQSTAQPHQIEAALAYDLSPALRLRLAAGASGAGFGVNAGGSGGFGYWRRYVGLTLSGWF
jgi:Flp pilus assembly protein TadD